MHTTKQARGFTLIELLVVVAIIGMLASVVLASLNTARSQGRDARRLADLKQMQIALELYYSTNNQYPAAISSIAPDYISRLPQDPSQTGEAGYQYCVQTNSQGYVLVATLESTGAACSVVQTSSSPAPCAEVAALPACQ